MRGPPRFKQRAGQKPYPVNEADARQTQIPAPVSGWNARGNLAAMKPTEAVQLDNIFPDIQEVRLRKGSISWATGLTGNVRTLMAYNSASAAKLWAATGSGIYEVTSTGAVGAAGIVVTNGEFSYVNMTTSGGSYICAVNGVDTMKLYDGTTWTSVTGVSTPAITGVTTSSLVYNTLHKRRQWFIEKDSMNLWYLATDAIAGAATLFPTGALFKAGGKLIALGTWTVDSGRGPDDYFVMVTSKGEMAVYSGTDPSSSSTWSLVGVYDVGEPVGNRPFADFGGDLLYLNKNGLFPISSLMQSTAVDLQSAFSNRIDAAFILASASYSAVFGWQLTHFKTSNMLVVNVPMTADTDSYQFVMNTATKAWCRFTGWNAACWTLFSGELYYALGSVVYKAWTGTADGSTAITGTCIQAYSSLGFSGQKEVVLVRPNVTLSSSASVQLGLDNDFKSFSGSSTLTYQPITSGGVWGTGLWGTAVWDGTTSPVEPKWTTVPNDLGYLHAMKIVLTTSTAAFSWTSTNFLYRPAGFL